MNVKMDEIFDFKAVSENGWEVTFSGKFGEVNNSYKTLQILLKPDKDGRLANIVSPPKKKMTIKEIEKHLGYEIELIG